MISGVRPIELSRRTVAEIEIKGRERETQRVFFNNNQ